MFTIADCSTEYIRDTYHMMHAQGVASAAEGNFSVAVDRFEYALMCRQLVQDRLGKCDAAHQHVKNVLYAEISNIHTYCYNVHHFGSHKFKFQFVSDMSCKIAESNGYSIPARFWPPKGSNNERVERYARSTSRLYPLLA